MRACVFVWGLGVCGPGWECSGVRACVRASRSGCWSVSVVGALWLKGGVLAAVGGERG
jgi:hypothetical protein